MEPFFYQRRVEEPSLKYYDIRLKIPGSENLENFVVRMRKAGLTKCYFFEPKAGYERPADEWWYRCLFLLSSEERYWETNEQDSRVCEGIGKSSSKYDERHAKASKAEWWTSIHG